MIKRANVIKAPIFVINQQRYVLSLNELNQKNNAYLNKLTVLFCGRFSE